jgi:hypothetical protein
MSNLRMNLKVCEGCGALWLRSILETRVYCQRCAIKLAEFPAVRARHVQVRKPRLRTLHAAGAAHTPYLVLAGGAR